MCGQKDQTNNVLSSHQGKLVGKWPRADRYFVHYLYTSSVDLLKLSESRGVAEQLAESPAAGEHEK